MHLTPKLLLISHTGGTGASSPQGSQCSQYTTPGCKPRGAGGPQGTHASGGAVSPSPPSSSQCPGEPRGVRVSPDSPEPPCPSRQPQVFFLKMCLVALPSIFVSWPRPLHPPSSLTAWVGLLRGFPLSQWSPLLITHQNKPFKEIKKNGKGYLWQGQD